eukprot:364678-Chlamydomonas_euryale.AAC.5
MERACEGGVHSSRGHLTDVRMDQGEASCVVAATGALCSACSFCMRGLFPPPVSCSSLPFLPSPSPLPPRSPLPFHSRLLSFYPPCPGAAPMLGGAQAAACISLPRHPWHDQPGGGRHAERQATPENGRSATRAGDETSP